MKKVSKKGKQRVEKMTERLDSMIANMLGKVMEKRLD
jgi:hypothetical protein